jgi:VanZ family protein
LPPPSVSSLALSVFLVVGGIAIIVAIAARTRGDRATSSDVLQSLSADVAIASSVAAIFAITLIPTGAPDDVDLFPFADIVEALEPPVDTSVLLGAASNILLFLPFGAALALRGLSSGKTALSGLVLSAAIELSQLLFISGRTASVDDLLLNALGAVLGHVLASPWMPPPETRARKRSRSEMQRSPDHVD